MFLCEKCDFQCDKSSDYERHINTAKHKNRTILNDFTPKNAETIVSDHVCKYCHKMYKVRNSLWYHEQKCPKKQESVKNIAEKNEVDNEIVKEAKNGDEKIENIINLFKNQLQENKELREMLMEQNKKLLELAESSRNNITNNITNNKFNLQIFLNEKCKDAPNFVDYIKSFDLKLSDFENFGTLGYIESISNIIVRELKETDIYKRPIHCSDLKREVVHIKDENTWKKDDDKKELRKAILIIAHKNFKQIPDWVKANPESKDIHTKKHDQYVKMLGNSMGEHTDEDNEKNYQKIIRNVMKEVLIKKI